MFQRTWDGQIAARRELDGRCVESDSDRHSAHRLGATEQGARTLLSRKCAGMIDDRNDQTSIYCGFTNNYNGRQ
jgi:hypothetical protein